MQLSRRSYRHSEIYPSAPSGAPNLKKQSQMFPLPKNLGPIVRQISSNGRFISFISRRRLSFQFMGTPHRVVANTLLYRPVLKLPQVLGRYLNQSLDIFPDFTKSPICEGVVVVGFLIFLKLREVFIVLFFYYK